MAALREEVRKLRERLKDMGSPAHCHCGQMVIVMEGEPMPELCPRCGNPGARILQIVEETVD